IYHSDCLHANNPSLGLLYLIQYPTTKLNRFHFGYSDRSFFDALSPLRDLDIFVRRKRCSRGAVDETAFRLFVCELYCRFLARFSLYKCWSARILQGCCGLARSAEFPFRGGGFLLDYFRRGAAGRAERELPPDGGIAIRCCGSGRTLRSRQRQLDANHANHGAAREFARSVARAKSRADQRRASGTRA